MRIPNNSIYPVITSKAVKDTTTDSAIKSSHNQKKQYMITAEIPREVSFELPEGRYRARISGLKPFIKQSAQ